MKLNIAVICENSTGYARRLTDGIGAYAQQMREWNLRWFDLNSRPEYGALTNCDGVIARVANDEMAESLKQLGVPVVDVFCLREHPGIIAVMPDHEDIGRMAAKHLMSKHYTSFAFVGYKDIPFSDGRRNGFKEELGQHVYTPAVCEIDVARHQLALSAPSASALRGLGRLKKWIRALPRPVALFAANDHIAINVLRLASEAGIAVPRELAILGVDDDRFLCAFAPTSISSIDPNPSAVGFAAARMLDAAIRKAPDANRRHVLRIPPKGVIERASTGHHAIAPDWLASLLDYIDTSIDKPISTIDLVQQTGLSTVTICKAFAQRLGTTPLKYITKTKMVAARRLLDNGDLLVKEVAARVGYNSPVRFSIAYKGYWGHAPRQTLPS